MGVAALPWHRKARCYKIDVDFYPYEKDKAAEEKAKRVCARCPVQEECLSWAIENGEQWGIWGGKTPEERKAPPHSSQQGEARARRLAEGG